MARPVIGLRNLASFVMACQNATVAATAHDLGVSASTLSARLHAIERDLGLRLFRRKGGYLMPLPAAFWLFEHATSLLHAERVARHTAMTGQSPGRRIRVRLDLTFAMGRFSKAVNRTIRTMQHTSPAAAFEVEFRTRDPAVPQNGQPPCAAEDLADIEIGYLGPESDSTAIPVHDDMWVAVSLSGSDDDPLSAAQSLIVPHMHSRLIDQITAYLDDRGALDQLRLDEEGAVGLTDMLTRFPGAAFLVPHSMIGDRLGLAQLHVTPLNPPLRSQIAAHITGPDPQKAQTATAFIEGLRDRLAAPEVNALFAPVLTTQQIHFFNTVRHVGGISAAARAERVTQPTVSSLIRRMEKALGQPLFSRTSTGVTSTAAGRKLAPLARNLEDRIDRILRERRDIAAHSQSTIAIGLLPSSGHDSAMTGQIAGALTALAQQFPECSLSVIEDSNDALHDAVRAGELNLAVVGSVLNTFPRIPLGASEPLSLIANPALGFGCRHAVTLKEAAATPLALGPGQLSIHDLFIRAAEKRRIVVNQTMEVGSLPLAIAMARGMTLGTVLPASSVQPDIKQRRLTASLISDAPEPGSLAVIFSGERSLSDIEKALVRALTLAFGAKGRG